MRLVPSFSKQVSALEQNCFDNEDNDLDDGVDCDDPECLEMPCGTGQAGQGAECMSDMYSQRFCGETACC